VNHPLSYLIGWIVLDCISDLARFTGVRDSDQHDQENRCEYNTPHRRSSIKVL
jgi:hypothetical protein